MIRRCGKRYPTEEAALRSKRGLTGTCTAVLCRCEGWHLVDTAGRQESTGKQRERESRPRKALPFRSARTARKYVTRREIVAELFAEPEVCEVPWCTEVATDPHEPLTRARGGDILDRANIRKVCHGHNVMFASAEEPWMYELGFLRHSWDALDPVTSEDGQTGWPTDDGGWIPEAPAQRRAS